MTTTVFPGAVSTLVAAGTTNGASATTRGVADVRGSLGGTVTMKITNGGTGPTVQCVGRLLIAHTAGSTPSPGSAGTDWKTVYEFGAGTSSGQVIESGAIDVPFAAQHIEVEFTGNTGQAVTCEAYISYVPSAETT